MISNWSAFDWLVFVTTLPVACVVAYRLGRRIQHSLWMWHIPYDQRVAEMNRAGKRRRAA